MSNHIIDDIFRSKLEEFQKKPSDLAWDAIETKLSNRKNKWTLFQKMAASLLIIFVSGLIGYLLLKPDAEVNIKDNTISSTSDKTLPLNEVNNANDRKQLQVAAEKSSSAEALEPKRTYYSALHLIHAVSPSRENNEFPETQIKSIPLTIVAKEIPEFKLEEERPTITIAFKSGNKNQDSDATSHQEKESTLKKAWDYALSVKNGEERPFNIKELKNELFAYDFKKKKSKTQN